MKPCVCMQDSTAGSVNVSAVYILTAAIEGPADQWVSFGVPAKAGQMVGANAVIVQPCSGADCTSGRPPFHSSPLVFALESSLTY